MTAFSGDAGAEAEHHQNELRRAAVNLENAIPGIKMEAYFVDFEGVWEVPITGAKIVLATSAP